MKKRRERLLSLFETHQHVHVLGKPEGGLPLAQGLLEAAEGRPLLHGEERDEGERWGSNSRDGPRAGMKEAESARV